MITGASSGIGRATAQLFHERGWNVIATMRTPGDDTQLAALENVLVTRLDVLDAASIQAAVTAGIERFGHIDVLLNNAGYGVFGVLEAAPIQNIRRQFDTNVIGLLETTQAVLPHFRAQNSGVLINVSSIGGQMTLPLGSLYHGTKFAVEGISESLSFELGAIGVRVKIVEPGAIRTDFGGRSLDIVNEEGMTEYQSMVQNMLAALSSMVTDVSEPSVVADVIYRAATDGSDQLRYRAGADAEQLLDFRKAADDATFIASIRERFGLPSGVAPSGVVPA